MKDKLKNIFKKLLKMFCFSLGLLIILIALTCLLLPGKNVFKHGTYNVSRYEILGERRDTIEVVAIGDSQVYSSLSPMEIWNDYGYTVFDSSEAAAIIPNVYKNVQLTIESQHPKVILLEANVLFRNPANQKKKYKVIRETEDFNPLNKYHDNWKKYLRYGSKDNWQNIYKGYLYVAGTNASENKDYMKKSSELSKIPAGNKEYLDKIIQECKTNNVKLVLVSFPTQATWNYTKHNTIDKIAKENDIEFIDLNLIDLNINWKTDTRDKGSHLNHKGAVKVSKYIGNYLYELGIFKDKRKDPEYEHWNETYKHYEKSIIKG